MSDALVNFKTGGEGRLNPKSFISARVCNLTNPTCAFNNSGEHAVKFGLFAFCFGLGRKGRLYLRLLKIF
jgi:hypothetical protein